MVNVILAMVCVGIIGIYLKDVKKHKLDTRMIVMIGIFSAMTLILRKIQFITYPQGGGITLFHMMPIMLLTVLFGRTVGMTAGLVSGLLACITGAYIVHPVQIIFELVIGMMVLGFAGIFGTDSKAKILAGCLFASMAKTTVHFIAGVVYFGQFAPEGMNPWLYSFIYNFSSSGVEAVLTVGLFAVIPVARFRQAMRPSIAKPM